MIYMPCELHCHTVHSDGAFSIDELLTIAKAESLSLIALTDHNTTSGNTEIQARFTTDSIAIPVVPGIEWTTDYGHVLVLAASRTVDWQTARLDNFDEKLSEISSSGGLCGIAHPYRIGFPICCGCTFEYPVTRFDLLHYIEVWSGEFPSIHAENKLATRWWSNLLDQGYQIAAAYGRDWHRRQDPALPAACTFLGFSVNSIDSAHTAATDMPWLQKYPENQKLTDAMHALQNGRTVVSLGPLLLFSVMRPETDECLEIGDRVHWSGKAQQSGSRRELNLKVYFSIPMVWHPGGRDYQIHSQTIKLIGYGNTILAEIDLSGDWVTKPEHFEVSAQILTDSPYLRAELHGSCMGIECLLALTSPIYLGEP